MSSVKQVIPSFIQGMTDQPDELKIPGQVRSVTDALPDVTLGLIKRPGYKHIAELSGSDYQGKWFNIFAENTIGYEEQYICNISKEGVVSVWAAIDIKNNAGNVVKKAGEPIPTTQTDSQPLSLDESILKPITPRVTGEIEYFKHLDKAQLQTLNIGATTLVTNRRITPTMSGDGVTNTDNPYEAFIELKQVAYGRDYALDILGPGGVDETIVSAQDVSVNPSNYRRNENDCRKAGADTINNVSGDAPSTGTGLTFRITVTCRVIPTDSNDSPGDSDYTVEIDLYQGGKGWKVGDTYSFDFKGWNYTITVESTTTRKVFDALALISYVSPTTGEGPALKGSTILNELYEQLLAATRPDNGEKIFDEVTVIGNGIYVKSEEEFTIATPESELFNILSTTSEEDEDGTLISRYSTVNNVGDLPQQCKHGLVVKVSNTFNDSDDYYVKFYGNEDADGPGVWEETIKPGIKTVFNNTTMPHLIRRSLATDGSLLFEVSPVDWIRRTVGDDLTNPVPSFVTDGTSLPTINNMILYRNRLVFLSSNNVILSQSGDLGNWFGDTALNIKSSDPIDINASVDTSTALYDGLVVNNGMVLFSKFNQFLFTTDSDILSPQTAKSSLLGTYDFNPNSNPFNMASNVGFFSSAGNDSIFWEMRDIFREGPPNVEERSKPVQRSLPSDLDLIVASREDGLILASSRYYNEVWGYRYYSQGDRQLQSAWFRWTVPGELLFHFNNTRGKYWIVYRDSEGVVQLMNMDLKEKLRSTSLEGVPYEYYIYLDNWTEVQTQPNAAKRRTEFQLPYTPDRDVYVYTLDEGEFRGRSAKAEYDSDVDVWWVPGTWTDTLAAGYKFEMEVKFPHFYVTSKEGNSFRSDTTGSLTLHRLKVNFSTVGMFTFELDRYGKDLYTMTTETTEMDGYDADRVAGYPDKQYTIPVYDKAVNSLLTMRSDHPTPATLLSLTMEGDYTTNYYKSV